MNWDLGVGKVAIGRIKSKFFDTANQLTSIGKESVKTGVESVAREITSQADGFVKERLADAVYHAGNEEESV